MRDRRRHERGLAALLIAALVVVLGAAWWVLDAGDFASPRDRSSERSAHAEQRASTTAMPADATPSRPPLPPASATAPTVTSVPQRALVSDGPDLPIEPVPFRVWGEVVDEQGRAVDQFTVTLHDAAADPLAVEPIAASRMQRTYSLLAGRAGSFRLQCDADGYRSQTTGVELTAEARQVHIDLTLVSASYVGIRFVTPAGQRLLPMLPTGFSPQQLAVVATRFNPGSRVMRQALCGQSDNVSPMLTRFDPPGDRGLRRTPRLPLEHDLVLELNEPPPIYVSAVIGDVVVATEPLPALVDSLDLRIDPTLFAARLASVTLRVLDADTRQPITDAFVSSAPIGLATEVFGRANIAADGVVTLRNLVPGCHNVYLRSAAHEHWSGRLRLASGQQLDLGTLLLTRAVEVSGKVIGVGGKTVKHFIVGVIRQADTTSIASGLEWQGASAMAEAGAFSIPFLGRGVHDLVFSAQPWALTVVRVDTTLGAIRDLRVELPEGVPVTLLVARAPAALANMGVARPGGSDFVAFPAKRGRARHPLQLKSGDYEAHLYDADGELLLTVPLHVAGATTRIDLGS